MATQQIANLCYAGSNPVVHSNRTGEYMAKLENLMYPEKELLDIILKENKKIMREIKKLNDKIQAVTDQIEDFKMDITVYK